MRLLRQFFLSSAFFAFALWVDPTLGATALCIFAALWVSNVAGFAEGMWRAYQIERGAP